MAIQPVQPFWPIMGMPLNRLPVLVPMRAAAVVVRPTIEINTRQAFRVLFGDAKKTNVVNCAQLKQITMNIFGEVYLSNNIQR